MKSFSIDIDGVIGVETKITDFSYDNLINNRVYSNTIEKINQLFDNGNTIILNTARPSKARENTIKWLKKNNVKFHKLVMDKPECDYYIDDRAIVGRKITMQAFIKFVSRSKSE